MNYLAHLFLAGNDHGMILGSLLEDYVTGGIENEKNRWLPANVKEGLRLHRFIDTFTDTDKAVSRCKELFYPGFGKYASVIVDVVFDHYLHKNWAVFSTEPFDTFRERVYFSLNTEFQEIQPIPLKKLVKSMTEHDWLKNYIHFWGVEKALSSLNRRVELVDLTLALAVMEEHYTFINEVFLDFFERLKKACEKEFTIYGK